MAAILTLLTTEACGVSEDRPRSAARLLDVVTTTSTVEIIPLEQEADGLVVLTIDRDHCVVTPTEVDGPVVRFTVNNADRLKVAISVAGTSFEPVVGGGSGTVQMRLPSGPVGVECQLYPIFGQTGRTVDDQQLIVR